MPATLRIVLSLSLSLSLLCLGVVAGSAEAAPFTPELEADYAYAESWWGAVPAGCSSITREILPDEALEGHDGHATQPTPGSEPVPCFLVVAEKVTVAPPCMAQEVVLHEYGHLLGYGHSEDPTNIMYPTLPGFICAAEELAALEAQLLRGLRHIRARCRQKKLRVELSECRRNERYWLRMLREARAR